MTEPSARADAIVEMLDARRADRPWLAGATLVAGCIHVIAALVLLHFVSRDSTIRPRVNDVVEIEIPKPPQPQPPPTPVVQRAHQPRSRRTASEREALAPPRPAEAAPISTKKDPANPLDLTNTIVAGSAPSDGGGSIMATGLSQNGDKGAAAPMATSMQSHPPPSAVAPPAAVGPERSRHATLMGSAEWKCPFPSEADAEKIDVAVATIRVDVDPAGRTTGVTILKDPGHGFGREARRCAMAKGWSAALDRNGTAIADSVTINVLFER